MPDPATPPPPAVQAHPASHGQQRAPREQEQRWCIGRYRTREEAERVSATYGDALYPNRTVEPETVGRRTDWLIFCDREARRV